MHILPSNVAERDYQIAMIVVTALCSVLGTFKLCSMRKIRSFEWKRASKIAFLVSLITSLPWFVSWFWVASDGGEYSFFSWFYFIISGLWTVLGVHYDKKAKKIAQDESLLIAQDESSLGQAIVTAVAVPVYVDVP